MNKTIALFSSLAATLALPVQSSLAQDRYEIDEGPQVTATLGWESEYVFRGIQASQYVVQPGVKAEVEEFYVGIDGVFSLESEFSHLHEIDFSGGIRHEVDDLLSIDLGGVIYYFPDLHDEQPGSDELTGEFLTGLGLQLPGDPWAYLYYDVRSEDFTAEGRLGHEIPLDEEWTLDMTAVGGHVWERDGKPWAPSRANYLYAELRADFRYTIDDNKSVSVGGRYSANSLGSGARARAGGINGANLWWGAQFAAEF